MNNMPTIKVLEFKTEYILSKDGTPPREVDWVKYAPIHAAMTNQTWERVDVMRPPEYIEGDDDGKRAAFMRHRWSMIEPGYNAWKSGQEIPENGTPLSVWGGINQDQARVLQTLGIKTVEEVAAITDVVITKIPFPNARQLPAQAKAFLDATDRTAAAERVAAQDAKIAALEAQHREALAELAAAKELLEEAAEKPRRGRPRKVDEPSDEAA